MIKVSIMGASGYGAAELLRQLLARPDVEILRLASKDSLDAPLSAVHRSLVGFDHLRLQDLDAEQCADGADLVFLAMPHRITAQQVMPILDGGPRIIDLSGDFRLDDAATYEADYGAPHPCPERLGSFVYGLPELNSEAIKTARHLASPGCFATAISLGLLPLAAAGLLGRVAVRNVSMTGSSGSGVRPAPGTHHVMRSRNLKAYKSLHHQHRPEIVQCLRAAGADAVALDFVPVSAPLGRGILAVSQLDMPDGHSLADVQGLYERHYGDNPLVRVLPPGASPEVAAVARTARTDIGLVHRHHQGRDTLCIISALDNLIKGGAGQAMQCFNLMTGSPAHRGMDTPGLWP